MIVPVTLALPCRLLKLDVLVGPAEGVTPLEDLVARGILAATQEMPVGQSVAANDGKGGADATMNYLTALLCVPQRVIMEVVGSLWTKGHLTVDFESGGIHLSEAARAKITSGQSLAADGELKTREFLFEPATGMILSTFHAKGWASETSIRLPLRPQLKLSDIPPAELVSSVQSALRNERQRTGRVNVLRVGFGSPALQSAERIVWLEVNVQVRRDPDNGRIQFVTNETAGWSQRSQRRLNEYFDRLMAEEPKNPVIDKVAGQAQIEREQPAELDDLFRRMRGKLDSLERLDLGQVQDRHNWLVDCATQIDGCLKDLRGAQAKVGLITRPEGHTWTVNDLIDSARRQIVLVVPDPDPAKVRQFLPGLRRALDREVQVVLIWGRASNERLNRQVENLWDELHHRRNARLLRNPDSAKTDACVVIQDDCRAIIGSHSPLGYRAPEPAEVSVFIEPAESGPDVPAAIDELLRWAKAEFAPWVLAQKIELAHTVAERQTSATPASDAVNPRRPDHPADPMSDFDAADVDATSLSLWAVSWRGVYTGLADARQQLIAKVAAVEVVRDGEHRTLLWEGLRDAQYRLVVSDDRLNSRSAGPTVARHLRERHAAGAVVRVLHPAPPQAETSLHEFAELARGTNAVSVLHQQAGGRVFIADDRVVAGSFSPFDDRHGEGIGRRISRLGVQIRHEPLAAELAELLGAGRVETPRAEAPAPVPEPPVALSCASAGIALLLQARALPAQDFGRVTAERLRAYAQPFEVLSSWRDSDVPRGDLRRVAAAVLRAGLGSAERAETWLGWLIEDAWARKAYVEAALLTRWTPETSDGVVTTPDGPLRAAALLAAALETGPLTGDMTTAVFDLGDSLGARTAGAASLVCDILIWGQTESQTLLSLLSGDLAPGWRAFCGRVESFGSAPLPLSRFTADQNRAETVRSLEDKRVRIAQTIDRIEALRNRFSFNAGIAMHRELFLTGGLLYEIRAAARAGMSQCQQLAPRLPRDVRRYLDDVIAGVGENPMEWLRQISFLRKIEDLVRDVRAVAAAGGDARADHRADDHHLVESLSLGRYLVDNWDALYAEARESGRPYELPAMGLLTILNPLMSWAKEQQ